MKIKFSSSISYLLVAVFVFCIFLSVNQVAALEIWGIQEGLNGTDDVGTAFGQDQEVSLMEMIGLGLKIIFSLLGLYFFVIIFIAGFNIMSSNGDQKAFGVAKDRLLNASIGLLVIFMAWALSAYIIKLIVSMSANDDVTEGGKFDSHVQGEFKSPQS